jgi:hypothetical protein
MVKLFYVPPGPNHDPYYDIGVMWNVVEVNLAVITACGPALRPLFRSCLPKLFGGSSGNYASKKKSALGYGASGYPSNAGTARHSTATSGIALKSMRGAAHGQHTECRSVSPSGSEEEIMTYNGILRTTHVQLNYDDHEAARQVGGHNIDQQLSKESMRVPV